jgi:ADP-dependent phosphofructokinase/glucokinase
MFGFGKKEMAKKLETLIEFAMVKVFGFCKTKQFKVKGELLNVDDNNFFAAAVTNYFFTLQHKKEHLEKFNSKEIESVGLQLLEMNENLREVIVQSQKAVYIVNYGWDVDTFPELTEILSKYGEEFPKVPNPASYEFLINTWK